MEAAQLTQSSPLANLLLDIEAAPLAPVLPLAADQSSMTTTTHVQDTSPKEVHSSDIGADGKQEGIAFESEDVLRKWLVTHNVKVERWGRGVHTLFEEVCSGAVQLCLSGGRPLRVVRVVNVRIMSDDGRHSLVCTHRTTDGVRKEVGQPLSGKLHTNETDEEAVRRCAREELGVEATPLMATRTEHTAAKTTSSIFPGLACRFHVVTITASVAKGQLQQQNFDTAKDKGGKQTTHHWVWQLCIALPTGAMGLSVTCCPASVSLAMHSRQLMPASMPASTRSSGRQAIGLRLLRSLGCKEGITPHRHEGVGVLRGTQVAAAKL